MGCDTQKNSRRANNLFQSTHPVWDATSKRRFDYPRIVISIHASRMGCDPCLQSQMVHTKAISIHASRMGCDLGWASAGARIITYFNPRIPYGMRPCGSGRHDAKKGFQSTHPVWDATMLTTTETATRLFQSTHPVWDATGFLTVDDVRRKISIHASRMGCDALDSVLDANRLISIHASRMGCDIRPRRCLPI